MMLPPEKCGEMGVESRTNFVFLTAQGMQTYSLQQNPIAPSQQLGADILVCCKVTQVHLEKMLTYFSQGYGFSLRYPDPSSPYKIKRSGYPETDGAT